jgi:hypothetical protein
MYYQIPPYALIMPGGIPLATCTLPIGVSSFLTYLRIRVQAHIPVASERCFYVYSKPSFTLRLATRLRPFSSSPSFASLRSRVLSCT